MHVYADVSADGLQRNQSQVTGWDELGTTSLGQGWSKKVAPGTDVWAKAQMRSGSCLRQDAREQCWRPQEQPQQRP